METNLTIKEKAISFLEVEKSKFYSLAYPFNSERDLDRILSEVKKEYPKARHYCYAYVLDKEEKYNDDGEPQGTAGKPILSQIKNANLKFTLVVVVRYFGGTLLGSGRLLRTYLRGAKDVIELSNKQEILEIQKIRVQIDIDFYSNFISYLNRQDFITLNTTFNDKITIDFLTPMEFQEDLSSVFYGKVDVIGKINYLYRKDLK